MWVPGTDEMSIDGTRALPAIWENIPDVMSKWEAFGTQAAAMAAVAGDGQAALGPALDPLGGTCKACHDACRAPE